MASVSIIAGDRPYADGTTGIYIRIIHDRQIYKKQICRVPITDFDRGRMEVRHSHPDHTRLNILINREVSEAKAYILDCQLKKVEPDPDRFLKTTRRGDMLVDNIRNRAEDLMAAGQYRTAAKHTSTANRIEELRMDVPLSSVSVAWVKKLDRALAGMGNNPNTRAKHMAVVSAVLGEHEGIISPFLRYKKPSNKTAKAKLTRDEFERFAKAPVTGYDRVCRDLFVFATLARGMRAFDIMTLTRDNITGDRLQYVPQKTAKAGKAVRLTISDRMRAIIDAVADYTSGRHRKPHPAYLFPIVSAPPEMYRTDRRRYLALVNGQATDVNKALRRVAEAAKIDKHITLHVARHTFSYLADLAGVSIGTIQQLLLHSKIATTQDYVEALRLDDELDEAAWRVF